MLQWQHYMLSQQPNIDLLLKKYLGDCYISGPEHLYNCPFCHHRKKKLSVNMSSGMWKCWVCDKRGRNVAGLLRCLGVKVEGLEKTSKKQEEKEEEIFVITLPEDFIPICNLTNGSLTHKKCFNYLDKRGITHQDALQHKIGISFSGSFNNRLIFPSFDRDGNLNFFTGRTIDNHPIKYFVPKTPKGYKNTIILNELNIDWTKPVIIVEGFIDLIKTGMTNVIPLFGSTLHKSSRLFAEIVKNRTDIYLCLDEDAKDKQFHIINDLLRQGIAVYMVDIGHYSDIGEMPKGEFEKCLGNAKLINENSLIKERIKEKMR